MKPADLNEECRARIVWHMTADDNLNQRVQIAQDRTVETLHLEQERVYELLYQNQQEGRSEQRSKLKNKHLRVLLVQIHGVPAAVQAAVPVRIQAALKPRLYHRSRFDESNQDSPKRQKVTHAADIELEGLAMDSERDGLQRHSDFDFLLAPSSRHRLGNVRSGPRPIVQDMYTRLLSANLDFDSELQLICCLALDECRDFRVFHVDRVFPSLLHVVLASGLGASNVTRGCQF